MYTAEERELFYNKTIGFFRLSELFEGVVQIGSGTIGYRDEYSDIDLMAAYYNKDYVENVKTTVINFFKDLCAGYINERAWTNTILGVSVYFTNGLEMDVSFGPTDELVVCSPQWKIALDKTGKLTQHMEKENQNFINYSSNYGIDDSIPHEFIYVLRRFNIAIKRCNYIYASSMLNVARQYVLDIQVLNEGKNGHEFNAYNTLNTHFQIEFMKTFPSNMSENALKEAKDQLFKLFFNVIENCEKLKFDESIMILLVD